METLTYTTEAGDRAAPKDLEERLRLVEEKIRREARETVEVLKVDIPLFVKRQVRDRFITAGDFADGFNEGKLRKLKEDVDATAERAGREVVPPLEEWEIWLEGPKAVPAPSDRRDFSANPEVQSRLQKVGDYLRELLERNGFPNVNPADWKDAYRLPTWFISGRLLVSLAESYWRNLEEFLAIRDALKALQERGQRTKRAEQWDSV